ncbi:MAG TPA: hypothetical protein VKU00_30735 [Chthonomonadaceae bacterium]|nr:hypothetical protein [Chthonomonadaceae bacterium]
MSEIARVDARGAQLMPALHLQPARTLAEVYHTMVLRPLETPAELNAFYRNMDTVRGGDKIEQIRRGLLRAHSVSYFKGFFMGHSGVGKSTEINRLTGKVADKFRPIRFKVLDDLNGTDFRPFDVLFVIIYDLMTQIHELGKSDSIPEGLLNELYTWFQTTEYTQIYGAQEQREESQEIGTPKKLAEIVGLLFNVKDALRYSVERKKQVTEYSYRTIGQLIKLINRLFTAANIAIQSEGQEWLVIGEEFDKPGVSPERVEEFFITHANILTDLEAHLIFNIPIALAYSEKTQFLPKIGRFCLFDTPVYNADHTPHMEGRSVLRTIMDARMIPELFEEGQQERLIVASGGNLSELFSMTTAAADNAALRTGELGKIGELDVTQAINEKRREYRNALGSSPHEKNPISYEDKAKRLVAIYQQEPGHDVPDAVLYKLLLARAVQEFNGEGWFGVHPLVVDILKAHEKLTDPVGTELAGGTF